MTDRDEVKKKPNTPTSAATAFSWIQVKKGPSCGRTQKAERALVLVPGEVFINKLGTRPCYTH